MRFNTIEKTTIYASFILFILLQFFLNNEINFETLTLTLLFSTVVFLPYFVLMNFKAINISSPSFLICLAISLYEISKFTYYINYESGHEISLSSYNYSVDDYFNASLYYLSYTLICMLSAFTFEYIIRGYSRGVSRIKRHDLKKTLHISVIIFFLTSLIYFFMSSSGNIFFFLGARIGDNFVKEIRGDSYIFILFLIYCLFLSPYLIFKKAKFAIVIFALSAIVFFLYTGSRGFIVYTIFSILLCKIYRDRNIPYIKIFVLSLAILIFFSSLGLARKLDDTKSFTDYVNIKNTATFSSYQTQLRDELIFANLEKMDDFRLSSVFSPVFMLIPRSLLGELKPNMIDGELAKKVWGRGDLGLPINISTELILNFGFFGFLYLFFLILILNKLKDILFRYDMPEVYLSLMAFSQTFLSSKLVYTLQLLVMLGAVILLSKFWKKNKNFYG